MSWSYNVDDLTTDTASGRLNVTRFLLGDTDTSNQKVQDEEIVFGLSVTSDNVYRAASYMADGISSKYSGMVDTELDGALSAKYSQLSEQYRKLSLDLSKQGKKYSAGGLGVSSGGISVSRIDVNEENTDRVKPAFTREQFKNV